MRIEPDNERQQLIEREILAGRFKDAAAFVGAAVRHFLIAREDLGHSRDQIDSMVAEAIASLERGEGVDGETNWRTRRESCGVERDDQFSTLSWAHRDIRGKMCGFGIYRPSTRPLEILRVLHGNRNVRSLLG